MENPSGKVYLTMSGSEVDGWKLDAHMYVEDRYSPGNYHVTTLWNRPKNFDTFEDLVTAAKEVINGN